MVVQYPHTLTVTTVKGSVQDEFGDWVSDAETDTMQFKCRAEPYESNNAQQEVDGLRYDYSWKVYTTIDVPVLQVGSKVSIDAAGVQIEDTVKRFRKGQLNSEIRL